MKHSKLILTTLLTVLLLSLSVLAADSAHVTVTVFDGTSLALAAEEVSVTDTDADGKLTIHDALYAAHEARFEGGAAAGYSSASTEYGLSLTKLWGIDNGGAYGYYHNNASPSSLSDAIADGDSITAFVYQDTTGWSDVYSYFDKEHAAVAVGEPLTLTLSSVGFDENWARIALPVTNAVITVDGKAISVTTDAEGKAALSFEEDGVYLISASSDSQTLVPPVCLLTVGNGAVEANGGGQAVSSITVVLICAAVLFAIAVVIAFLRRKK